MAPFKGSAGNSRDQTTEGKRCVFERCVTLKKTTHSSLMNARVREEEREKKKPQSLEQTVVQICNMEHENVPERIMYLIMSAATSHRTDDKLNPVKQLH